MKKKKKMIGYATIVLLIVIAFILYLLTFLLYRRAVMQRDICMAACPSTYSCSNR